MHSAVWCVEETAKQLERSPVSERVTLFLRESQFRKMLTILAHNYRVLATDIELYAFLRWRYASRPHASAERRPTLQTRAVARGQPASRNECARCEHEIDRPGNDSLCVGHVLTIANVDMVRNVPRVVVAVLYITLAICRPGLCRAPAARVV